MCVGGEGEEDARARCEKFDEKYCELFSMTDHIYLLLVTALLFTLFVSHCHRIQNSKSRRERERALNLICVQVATDPLLPANKANSGIKGVRCPIPRAMYPSLPLSPPPPLLCVKDHFIRGAV